MDDYYLAAFMLVNCYHYRQVSSRVKQIVKHQRIPYILRMMIHEFSMIIPMIYYLIGNVRCECFRTQVAHVQMYAQSV